MKKMIALVLAVMMLTGILAVPAMAEETLAVGTLSYLNMTEEDQNMFGLSSRKPMIMFLFFHGVLTEVDEQLSGDALEHHQYDSLNVLLLALESGKVKAIELPYYTAKYLCSTNDKLKLTTEYHPEKATNATELALARLSDGYSFMLKEENTALRDTFDAQLTAMREDGTLQKLIDEHIVKVAEGGEPVAVSFEQFKGEPIKVGVSGDLPPMDYAAANGSLAGFNTAVLAEIGRRLQKNIQLVQVENVGRSLALSEGTVDVVFWTRALSEKMVNERVANQGLSDEEREAKKAERREAMTDEERAILDKATTPSEETRTKIDVRDMPAGTIITQPYFSDFPVLVVMK